MIDKKFSKYKKILLLGAAGIGMSSLAVHLKNLNIDIFAYDDKPNKRFFNLKNYGIKIQEITKTNEFDLIIRSLAINENHKLLKNYKGKCITYPEAVGKLTQNYKLTAISGTHGKTTTTAMVCKILKDNNVNFNALIGSGLIEEGDKNFIIEKNSDIFVIEACEYQDGFLNYNPETLAITNLEHEHFDAYATEEDYLKSFQELIYKTKTNLILNKNCKLSKKLIIPQNLKVSYFDYKIPIELKLDIKHNNLNGNCAIEVSKTIEKVINCEKSLNEFKGTKRRQEIIYDKGITIIDDYAHHPTEIESTLESIEKNHKNKNIILFYQPHQLDRTEKLFNKFASSLNRNYEVIIPNIYKARDEQNKDSDEIGKKLAKELKNGSYVGSLEETKKQFDKIIESKDLIIIMGAGDILKILPDKYKS